MKSAFLKMGTRQWVILLLLGLLLAVAALPASHKEVKKQEELTAEEEENSALERKLESILSSVEGVGKVQTMVMTDEEKDAGGFYSSGIPKVTGVLVSAQGAEHPVVAREIQEAVQALFQVEAHKIKVMKMVTAGQEEFLQETVASKK